MNNCKKLVFCVACGSADLHKFLDLNNQPLANNFTNSIGSKDQYPLAVNYCKSCSHSQLTHSVDPSMLFKNYIYVSGTSTTLKNYFDELASKITKENSIGSILDIACNDGTQLDSFKRLGWDTYGVDPAENLYTTSSKEHKVICDFWPTSKFKNNVDVIIAQNVLAHTPTPLDFLKACADKISSSGKIYIQTSQSQMYQRGEFDTVYHEHISFFSIESMYRLARRANLFLTNVEIMPIHGDSYLFTLEKKHNIKNTYDMQTQEVEQGRRDFQFYEQFSKTVKDICVQFRIKVSEYKKLGYTVAGYGAAAKGMTFLNAANAKLDFIVDDNPLKQGTFSPAFDIPVVNSDMLKDVEKLIIVPLAWNFLEEIRLRVKAVNNNAKYLTYFPSVTTID